MHPKCWHCQNWVDPTPPPPNPGTLANLANKSAQMRLTTFFGKSAEFIFASENVKEMWLNDLFWGIRAHFWGKLSLFGDE